MYQYYVRWTLFCVFMTNDCNCGIFAKKKKDLKFKQRKRNTGFGEHGDETIGQNKYLGRC